MMYREDMDIYAKVDWAIQNGSMGPKSHAVMRDVRKELASLAAQLAAMQARAERAERLYELAWAECLAWRAYEIEACDHACDPPVSVVNAHDTARSEAGRQPQ